MQLPKDINFSQSSIMQISSFEERMGDLPTYGFVNGPFMGQLKVAGQICSFEMYKYGETFSIIQKQFAYFNDGSIYTPNNRVHIHPEMSLQQLTSTTEDIDILGRILTKVVNRQSVRVEDFIKGEQNAASRIINRIEIFHQRKMKIIQQKQEQEMLKRRTFVLRGREEFQQRITLKVEPYKTFKDVFNMIDQKAQSHVQPIEIMDQYNKIYNRSNFDTKFSSLGKYSKTFIIKYPPPLKIAKDTKLLIKLINSTYAEGMILMEINPATTIKNLSDEILKRTQDKRDFSIHDYDKKVIHQNKWKITLEKLYLRNCQLYMVFPPLVSFNCQVSIQQLPLGNKSFTFKVDKETTLFDLIRDARTRTKYLDGQFTIKVGPKIYTEQSWKLTFFQLNLTIKDKVSLSMTPPKSFLRLTSLLFIKNEGEQLRQVTVKQLVDKGIKKEYKTLSFNPEKRTIETGTIVQISPFSQVSQSQLYSLTVTDGEKQISLELAAKSTVMTSQFNWKMVQSLVEGERLIYKENLKEVKIVRKQKLKLKLEEELYSIKVLPYHNYLTGGIITHNGDSKRMVIYEFTEGSNFSRNSRQLNLHDKIGEINCFKGKIVKVGGFTLNSNLTVGDYRLSDFGSVFVYPPTNPSPKLNKLVISEWMDSVYEKNDLDNQLRNKWCRQYLAVHEGKIFEVKQSIDKLESLQKPSHLLVAPQANLERCLFTQQTIPKYKSTMQKHLTPYKQLYKPASSVTNKDVAYYPIWLYTSSHMYQDLKKFVQKWRHNMNSDSFEKWFSILVSINQSMRPLPKVNTKITYRGIKKCLAEFTFKPDIIIPNQKPIIFYNVQSSSTSIDTAKGFADYEGKNGEKKKGTVFKIQGRSGRDLINYTQYKYQGQVLMPPFIYFICHKYYKLDGYQFLDMEEVPLPQTDKTNVLFWVDDQPTNNTAICKYFESKGIEVVQVTSTKIMRIILKQFFGILQAMGKRIVIISDMNRTQYGVEKTEAGIDLFETIYNKYGMSVKGIIFTSSMASAKQKIKKRNIKEEGNWVVHVSEQEIKKEVLNEFGLK